jgi:hypothetical protein
MGAFSDKLFLARRFIMRKNSKARTSTIRTEAKVVVTKPVNGVATKKKASRGPKRGHRSSNVTTDAWPKKLLQDAKHAVRPGEKLVVVSPTEARTVYTH